MAVPAEDKSIKSDSRSIRSDELYGVRKKRRSKDEEKHRKYRVPEVKYRRNEKNYWPHRSHYYLYVVMLGNGPDFLPYMICFSLEISGLTFFVFHLLSALFLAMPLIYMEIFLGRYTTFTNSQMYRMTPIFFGFGVMVLMMNIFYIPVNMVNTSHFFITFLKLMIEPNLFKQCPIGAANGTCYDGIGKVNRSSVIICGHEDYNCPMETRLKYVTEYIYWETFKTGDIDKYPQWQTIIALIFTWFVIGAFLILGMRVIGALLKAMTIICWVIFAIIYAMALSIHGTLDELWHVMVFNKHSVTLCKFIVIAFYTIAKMGLIIPTGYMTASAYAKFPKRMGTGGESMLLVICNVAVSLFFTTGIVTIAGALAREYGFMVGEVMSPLIGIYLSLILQFLTHMDSPTSFIWCYLFFFWMLLIIRTAIMVHLLVLNLYDYLPQLSYFPNYVVVVITGACGIISLVACLHFFVQVTDIVAVNYIILCVCVHVIIESCSVSCCYGVKRLCDDIHFLTGRKPMRFWFLAWYAIPVLSLGSFICLALKLPEVRHIESLMAHLPLSMWQVYAGGSLLIVTILVTFAASFLFAILSFRQANVDLLKPQFYWGPPRRDIRISRKSFAPRTCIKSEPPRKKKLKFRLHSIRQMHEKDIAERVKRGRIFVDGAYFRSVHLGKGKSRPLSVDRPTVIYK